MANEYKVGDKVAIKSLSGWSRTLALEVGEVERVTKTQVIAFNGRRFRSDSGFEVGFKKTIWREAPQITPLSDELIAEAEHGQAIRDAEKKCFDWADVLRAVRCEKAIAMAALLPDLPGGHDGGPK